MAGFRLIIWNRLNSGGAKLSLANSVTDGPSVGSGHGWVMIEDKGGLSKCDKREASAS